MRFLGGRRRGCGLEFGARVEGFLFYLEAHRMNEMGSCGECDVSAIG